jgi:hypothetical protein
VFIDAFRRLQNNKMAQVRDISLVFSLTAVTNKELELDMCSSVLR